MIKHLIMKRNRKGIAERCYSKCLISCHLTFNFIDIILINIHLFSFKQANQHQISINQTTISRPVPA